MIEIYWKHHFNSKRQILPWLCIGDECIPVCHDVWRRNLLPSCDWMAGVPISLATTLSGGEWDRAGTLAFFVSVSGNFWGVERTTDMLISRKLTKENGTDQQTNVNGIQTSTINKIWYSQFQQRQPLFFWGWFWSRVWRFFYAFLVSSPLL